jgi:histidine ammonia-lyase
LGKQPATIEDVVDLAHGVASVSLDGDEAVLERLEAGQKRLRERLDAGETVYGVTTGFGESCVNEVEPEHIEAMPLNLMRFHGCGTGALLTDEESAAVVAARLTSLVTGWSAVRPTLLVALCSLLEQRVLPCIPSEGSVGASGDLTPLSYVVAALVGEREVTYRGEMMEAAAALKEAGIEPVTLAPKESLAIMNGTSVMAALGCLSFARARRLARLSATLTAMASDVMRGNPGHFDDRIFAAKPHVGQRAIARWIREDIEYDQEDSHEGRIQDRYSIRCTPHVVGVLVDALPWMRTWLETELNGANDNPLIDPETGEALHGGNFYGGHVAFVCDGLKNAVANVADLLDRQLALLCSPVTNNGLPENLEARAADDHATHHGFKAMQIAASALTAEALKLCMPASVFSRSTECHNQDKVSMGTIAARDCQRVLELSETVAAIHLLALSQAVDLRGNDGCHARALAMRDAVRKQVPKLESDRRQDADIARVLEMIRSDALPIGDVDFP